MTGINKKKEETGALCAPVSSPFSINYCLSEQSEESLNFLMLLK
jgi:hypothetical protein